LTGGGKVTRGEGSFEKTLLKKESGAKGQIPWGKQRCQNSEEKSVIRREGAEKRGKTTNRSFARRDHKGTAVQNCFFHKVLF